MIVTTEKVWEEFSIGLKQFIIKRVPVALAAPTLGKRGEGAEVVSPPHPRSKER